MKKIIILFAILFINLFFASCSENKIQNIDTKKILQQQVIDTSLLRTGEILKPPLSENIKKLSTNLGKNEIKKEFEKIKLYSPVYTLTGITLSGTTKIEVVFSGTTKKDRYFLTKFETGDREFSTNLRLDYGNIEKGSNIYEVIFYRGEDIVGKDRFLVNVDYEEIKAGGGVIYLGNPKSIPLSCNDEIEPVLIQEEGKFRIIQNGCFTYSNEDDYYLEMKNIKINNQGEARGDLYINGIILDQNIAFSTSSVLIPMGYDKQKNIFIQEGGPYPGDCDTSYDKTIYDINNKTYAGSLAYLNYCKHILTQVYPGLENGGLDDHSYETGNSIVFYSTSFERFSQFPTSSIFSIRNGDYSNNYIYDSRLNFTGAIKQEENDSFLYKKDNYTFNLGNKKFEIDFQKLKQAKQKMHDVLYRKENPIFTINMKKITDNSFTLAFDIDKIDNNTEKNPKIEVKSIGITSCKPNNSAEYYQEYILKTQTDEGNFTYNISEKLGNKCDIPYKIQVYYEDGTKDNGEYYILFDY